METLVPRDENSWIENVLEEIETGPLNTDALRYVRQEAWWKVPPAGAQRLLRIASDPGRRGDVRQIAWLLARPSAETNGPPYTPDMELLRYLEPEQAAFLVTVLFGWVMTSSLSWPGWGTALCLTSLSCQADNTAK